MNSILKLVENKMVRWLSPAHSLPIQFDITNVCNLRCVHCYHPNHRNEGALGLNEWIQILKEYDALVTRLGYKPRLILCGGEPLLSPNLSPILQSVSQRKQSYEISILTNGTVADRFDFNSLNSLPQTKFQVSLDGSNAVTHDRVRGKGSFEKTLKGIRTIQEHGFEVQVLAVLSKRNSGLIHEFFDLAREARFSSMGFTRMITKGYAEGLVHRSEDRALDAMELRDAYREILFHSARTRIKSSAAKPLFTLLHPEIGASGRFGEGLVVDHQGYLLASSRSRIKLGHAIRDGLERILFEHPLLKSIRKGEIEQCGDCQFLQSCGGDRNAAYASSGNYLGADPGCWKNLETQRNQNET